VNARTIILANGELADPIAIRARLVEWRGARVIAADGGTHHAKKLGLRVDDVVGDADSLTPEEQEALQQAGARFHLAPADKDETDLELALLLAVQEGAREIRILGALGGRMDMTLANVLLLTLPALEGLNVCIWHGRQTAWLIRPPGGGVTGAAGDTVSLIALGSDAHGVRSTGLVFPLKDETLAFGPARGVSNVLIDSRAAVRLKEGLLLAVHTPGRAE
jgi:thiamine pyrophosphokinase